MNKEELCLVKAGASSISGTLINAAVKALSLALEIGRSIGSSIRRKISKTSCPA